MTEAAPLPADPDTCVESNAPRLDADMTTRINYASLQNSVPLLRRIVVDGGASGLPAGTLTASVHPSFAQARSWPLPPIAPGTVLEVAEREVKLIAPFFDALDEAERGTLTLHAQFDAHPDLTLTQDIDLLARDEWGGISQMGQLLAAFVQPGDRAVARILHAASEGLRKQGLPDGMSGYQAADPRAVWSMVAAIWSAIEGMGLHYAVPPASFERNGQKIRTPARIEAEGLATCLDTTLLLAATLEQAGLNPVCIFTHGHAFTGVWLTPRHFDTTETREVTDLRKSIVARDLLVFETTLLTKGKTGLFDTARAEAVSALSEAREHEFEMAIDIARCRSAGIRPLPRMSRQIAEEEAQSSAMPQAIAPDFRAPDDFEPPEQINDIPPGSPQGRIERWQKKLLDLSLRNRLLNFRETRASVPLRCHDVPMLEDFLTEGDSFKLISLLDENPRGGRDAAQYLREHGEDIDARLIRDALDRRELCAPLNGGDLRTQLTNLYRKAKGDLAEGGTNTLFLAVGFLRWKQSESDKKSYRAPLLLLPVTLRRASAASPFSLVHQGDEVRFNLTLLEKLAEQGIEAPDLKGELPRDSAGLDVPRIFARMRALVRDVPGFEVTEDLTLSTFSFAKYLMWKDLVDRTDQLRNNALVAHLIDTPSKPFIPHGAPGLPSDKSVDRRVTPEATFMPLPADASQTAVVVGAAEGHNMIVIGPPGTGKSQTIANLISHCLAHGKTVLFVAEKAAALDVVHRRLSQYGLGDAVLELHSNKADKKGVIAQLGRAWTRDTADSDASQRATTEWAKLSAELGLERERLNDYVEALHHRHPNGLSVFAAIGTTGTDPGFALSWEDMNSHRAENYAELGRLAAELGDLAPRLRDPGGLTLIAAPAGGWSNSWVAALSQTRSTLAAHLRDLLAARASFHATCGLMDPAQCLTVAKAIVAEQDGDRARLNARDPAGIVSGARALHAEVTALAAAEAILSVPYAPRDISKIPVARLEDDLRQANAKIWPFSALKRNAIRRELASYASGKPDTAIDLPLLEQIQTRIATIAANPLADLPGWAGRETKTAPLIAAAQRVAQTGAAFTAAQLPPRAPTQTDRVAAQTLLDAQQAATGPLDEFAQVAGIRPTHLDTALQATLDDLHLQMHRLQDWLLWCALEERADLHGLAPLVDAVLEGNTPDAQAAFAAAYAHWWVPLAIDAAPALRGFIGWQHDKRIAAFRDLDARHQDMAAAEVRRRIAHNLPRPDNVAANSSLGRLRNLMSQTRPRESIRSLLGNLGADVTRLTPCVLMSPLSIAQYLPAQATSFDIVLFDEASQITTWDAIGAIARGRQSIIVGDPKQMPPSSGFQSGTPEDEDLDYFEKDQASILDEAVASGVPQALLRVHYRSRDEGLIAFSNYRYYDGALVTFPAPKIWGEAVQFHKINGIYERGKSRTNPEEARTIAAFVTQRLTDWLSLPDHSRPTLGVVTFNLQQQQLILDHLDRARTEQPDLEWFFAEDRIEPVIVKNLENIQGDERDVMIFSITFGHDEAGKLSMNFGPMNQDGGQKRLNVAVSRARQEMHVFSSLDARDVDISRSKSQGVRDLRDFLDYAARGPEALTTTDTGSMGGVDSPFEADVRQALEARGWQVRTQIGVSGFRIDLGVVHPDHAGRYLAGVECDGARYHSSPTARDRDRMRQTVLEGLGWTIERIWSTEWFQQRKTVLDRLDEALKNHLKVDRARPASPRAPESLPELPPEPEPLHMPARTTSQMPQPDSLLDAKPDLFFEPSYTPHLTGMIEDIVTAQGPIHIDHLANLITTAHGWSKTGRRIRERVARCAQHIPTTTEPTGTYLWSAEPTPMIAWRGVNARDPGQIPLAEIAGLLAANPWIATAEDPEQTLARELGLQKLRASRRAQLTELLSAASNRGSIP